MSSSSTKQKYATCIFKHLMKDGSYGYYVGQVDSNPTTWTEGYYRSFIKKKKYIFNEGLYGYENALSRAKLLEAETCLLKLQVYKEQFGYHELECHTYAEFDWKSGKRLFKPSSHGIMNIDCFMNIRPETLE